MAEFTVKRPIKVPTTFKWRYRRVTSKDAARFWKEHFVHAKERGCYLFAIRTGSGIKPFYAGKATGSFKPEVFTSHKLGKYNSALRRQRKGAPILFFVSLEKTRGRINKKAIDEAESFLIQAALKKNPRLLNDKKTKVVSWVIKGVVRSGKGKRSHAATDLCRCIRL